jgi:hypothetical protein
MKELKKLGNHTCTTKIVEDTATGTDLACENVAVIEISCKHKIIINF